MIGKDRQGRREIDGAFLHQRGDQERFDLLNEHVEPDHPQPRLVLCEKPIATAGKALRMGPA
jgi:hypothetical protein